MKCREIMKTHLESAIPDDSAYAVEVTCSIGDSVLGAELLMGKLDVSRMAVAEHEGRPRGVISLCVAEHEHGRTASAVVRAVAQGEAHL